MGSDVPETYGEFINTLDLTKDNGAGNINTPPNQEQMGLSKDQQDYLDEGYDRTKDDKATEEREVEVVVEEFFRRRFPKKDIEFEKKCGYFGEWVKRFESGEQELVMDMESLGIWKVMQLEDRWKLK